MGATIKKIVKHFTTAVTGKQQDFTSGSIRKAIFMLSIPMILEMMMESIFFLVDAYFVSSLGPDAIATVGLTESVLTLVYAIAIGLSMGVTAIVARRTGEGNIDAASQATVQSIFLGIAVAAIVGAIGIVYPKEILSLMGGSTELVESGYRYTQILLGGNVTIMLLFLINAAFRGAGDASVAMKVLIVSNLLNIVLDPLFIFGWGPVPAFGVAGAAIATTIGRGIGVIIQLLILILGWSRIKIGIKYFVFKAKIMLNLIKVSLGGIGQFIIGTSSWVFLMRIMAEFGSEALAGYTIAIRVLMFTMMPAWGMSNAAATLVGQNLGAKQPERAETSVWKTGKYIAVFMIIVSVFYLIFAEVIIKIFSDDSSVIEFGALSLRVIAAGYVFYAYGMVVIQSFNGAGDTKTPTIINFFCFWLFQLPFAYLTAIMLDWGALGVLLAITTAEILIAIIGIIWFKKGKWKLVEV
ncbi:putative MATE family efflux protein [Ulvibacter sp. MAR_2010_11]|uniref:MATE family efflux transporter n=1 Tax=Ulvibacter sp. MAR_2010_11 TaxID=1250229 RepID=UPI000C2BA72B|nr:MATE family efflux transporter [Ulvibacter sp. MAR_2010_11]PKA83251.1 putative MATE family efflux protein [Ulvibacter sp. MAR_2010_11]